MLGLAPRLITDYFSVLSSLELLDSLAPPPLTQIFFVAPSLLFYWFLSANKTEKTDEDNKGENSSTDAQNVIVKVEPTDVEMSDPNTTTDKSQSTNVPPAKRKKKE